MKLLEAIWLISLPLAAYCVLPGCKSTRYIIDTKPVVQNTYSNVRYDKVNASSSYINNVLFQRIPILGVRKLGNELESCINGISDNVIKPLDNTRHFHPGGCHIRIDGDADVKNNSLSIMIVISW